MVDIPEPDPLAKLYQRAEAAIPRIAEDVLAAFFARAAGYQQLPPQLVNREISAAIALNLRLYLHCLRERRPPRPEELTEQIGAAIRRAQQGVPLEVVLGTYHIAAQVGWEAMAALAEPAELPELLSSVPGLLGYLSVAVPAVAASYLHEQQTLDAEHREARRALVTALLTGAPAEPLAERLGISLSEAHTVLHLRLGPPPQSDGADPQLAARTLVRRLQAELPPHTLAAVNHTGGTLLLPADDPAEAPADGPATALALSERLHLAAGTTLLTGIATAATRAAIPAAVHQATDIADLATRLGRPPGAYQLDDVLLEYQLCRPGPGRERLNRILDELTQHQDLLWTLRVFLASGHNRHRAAAELHIHRNTLNHRLRRIATLTGHSPADPAGARILAAALTVRDFAPR
ncbi:helix-turn-helix domain-containing protein [Crossiella sp. CA-258035]|uniref:PucR family transcriptional regulator n=1 Tax=Crossiella sp. CA-258035 TaxID=2981138 RepID=UPI0024BC3E73|nr:helix-turn-helix domain-containing protein [Crossiella sp. CA-258035]WHT17601.1 helix-turn-helix domain-containing protein [Crossiella sp. CA-258035]